MEADSFIGKIVAVFGIAAVVLLILYLLNFISMDTFMDNLLTVFGYTVVAIVLAGLILKFVQEIIG